MSTSFADFQAVVSRPYPRRDAARALRRSMLQYLVASRPEAGTRLLTEAELSKASKLSRSTVRRALDPLVRDGWLARRVGDGTYVGPRLAQPPTRPASSDQADPLVREMLATRPIRVAVLVFKIGDLAHDWYTPLVLEGLDQAAEELGVSVELLGNRDHDIDAVARRIERTRPDMLACLTNDPRTALVVRDAQRMGIPCVLTGTPHLGLGVPVLHEDNHQAMQLAVEHLASRGHRRIGLVIQRIAEPWTLHRHEAFTATLQRLGLASDESQVLWLPMQVGDVDRLILQQVAHFIRQRQLTALVSGNDLAMHALDGLVRGGQLDVPREVSVVSFEQDYARRRWLGLAQPTTVVFPLREMGRRLAEMARASHRGETLPRSTVLRAVLLQGQSVISC